MCESSAAIAADLLASDAGTPAPCLARSSALALAISPSRTPTRASMLFPLSGSLDTMESMESSIFCLSRWAINDVSFSAALLLEVFGVVGGGLVSGFGAANDVGGAATAEPAAIARPASLASPPHPASTPFHPPLAAFPGFSLPPAALPPAPPFPPPPPPPAESTLAPSPALVLSSLLNSRSWSDTPAHPSRVSIGASTFFSSSVHRRWCAWSRSSSACVRDERIPLSVTSKSCEVSSALKYLKWLPSWVPARDRPPLNTCRRYTFSSTVPHVTSRYTTTSRV